MITLSKHPVNTTLTFHGRKLEQSGLEVLARETAKFMVNCVVCVCVWKMAPRSVQHNSSKYAAYSVDDLRWLLHFFVLNSSQIKYIRAKQRKRLHIYRP